MVVTHEFLWNKPGITYAKKGEDHSKKSFLVKRSNPNIKGARVFVEAVGTTMHTLAETMFWRMITLQVRQTLGQALMPICITFGFPTLIVPESSQVYT